MKTKWITGLTGQAKEAIKASFLASKDVRDRLKLICIDKIRINHNKRITEEGYSNPSWAFLQADASGYERALTEIISLLED